MNTECSEKENDSFMPRTQFASPSLSSLVSVARTALVYLQPLHPFYVLCHFHTKDADRAWFQVVLIFMLALQKPEIICFGQGLGRFQFSFTSTETRDFLSGTGSFSVQLYVHRNQTNFCQGLGRFQFSFTSTETREWVIFSLALRPQQPDGFR